MNVTRMESDKALDQAADSMIRSLSAVNCVEYSVPEQFYWKGIYQKTSMEIHPRIFDHPLLDFARVVRVRSGAAAQVLNAVFFPKRECSLPIFGCEILVFRKGLHLFVLDAFPTVKEQDRVSHHLQHIHSQFREKDLLSAIPDWGKKVFGPSAVISKPKSGSLPLDEALGYLNQFLTTWVHQLHESKKSMKDLEICCQRTQYLIHHAKDEPAGPFLSRIAGQVWADRFIHDFLFPKWLQNGTLLPSWLSEQKLRRS